MIGFNLYMMKTERIGFLCLFTLVATIGCTKVDVKYPDPETESAIVITPSETMPAGTKYHLYDARNGTVTIFNAQPDGSLTARLPFGNYHLVAVNTDARGVEFKEMETFGAAAVYLKVLRSIGDSVPRTLVSQPDSVDVFSIDGIVVEKGKTAAYSATPHLLTQTVFLNMDLSKIQAEVTAISGSLNGVYAGVSLFSQNPVTANAATTAVYFDTASDSAAHTASPDTVSFRCFGLLNPTTAGSSYTNELQLTLTFAGGSHLNDTINLTEATAKALSSGGNPLSIDVPPINPEDLDDPGDPDDPDDPTPTHPTTGIEDWEDGGSYEETIN
jgi:hypothetical protein